MSYWTPWTPVARGEILIPDEQPTPGLITAETNLKGNPDPEWRNAFHNPLGVTASTTMRPPRLIGDKITMEVQRAEQLERMVRYVDGAIGWANQWYEGTILPRIQAERQEKVRQDKERQDELSRARDIAKGL